MAPPDLDQTEQIAGATLVVPEDWWKIALHPRERRHASIRSLVARQFRGLDDQPILRRGMAGELLEVAGEAAEHYGLVMYLSRQTVAGLPLPVSLVVRRLPAELGGMDRLHDQLAGEDQVDVADLPAGRCLRRIRAVEPAKDGYSELGAALTVDYWLDVPTAGGLLQLTFSSPLAMLAEAWTELFDAIASTVTWSESGKERDD